MLYRLSELFYEVAHMFFLKIKTQKYEVAHMFFPHPHYKQVGAICQL